MTQILEKIKPLSVYCFRVGRADGALTCEARIVSPSLDQARQGLEDVLTVHNAESEKASHPENHQYLRLTFNSRAVTTAEILHQQELRCDMGICFERAVHIDLNDNARCQKHHDQTRANP
jgi:hypothetical protein